MRRQQQQNEKNMLPQYYYPIVQFPNPDRLAKLLELGDPNLFDGGSSNISFIKGDELPKLSSPL